MHMNKIETTYLPSESSIQSECFRWHWNAYPQQRGQLFMVYNNPKNAAHGSILKGMGMVRGVSDLIYLPGHIYIPGITHGITPVSTLCPTPGIALCCPSPVLFLECKLPGEHQKPEQIEFEKLVTGIGHQYYIFRSLAEFQAILAPYLAKSVFSTQL